MLRRATTFSDGRKVIISPVRHYYIPLRMNSTRHTAFLKSRHNRLCVEDVRRSRGFPPHFAMIIVVDYFGFRPKCACLSRVIPPVVIINPRRRRIIMSSSFGVLRGARVIFSFVKMGKLCGRRRKKVVERHRFAINRSSLSCEILSSRNIYNDIIYKLRKNITTTLRLR